MILSGPRRTLARMSSSVLHVLIRPPYAWWAAGAIAPSLCLLRRRLKIGHVSRIFDTVCQIVPLVSHSHCEKVLSVLMVALFFHQVVTTTVLAC